LACYRVADSPRSWTISRKAIAEKTYDLKAVNPNAKSTEDTRTLMELLDLIEEKEREVSAAIDTLRKTLVAEV
jgi:type I restriction enzyme M protein